MADSQISASVGRGGANRPADVKIVQALLNKAGAKLAVNGNCDPLTIAAIREFQKGFLRDPDGRVDPGGATMRRLALLNLALLPQVSGRGYYPYSPTARQYGTAAAIKALEEVAGAIRHNRPNLAIGIGDISLEHGGDMPPHKTHRDGKQADIRPLRKDGLHMPVSISETQYSREETRLLAQSLLAHRNVRRILFNDTQISGVHYFTGHDNHLHVEMRS